MAIITDENAQFGLYAVTDVLADDGSQCALFVGYFLTRADMERYALEFQGTKLIAVAKRADGQWENQVVWPM